MLTTDEATDVQDTLLGVIQAAIAAHPRSLQKRIGPSEIGIPCDRCLGHKLAGTPEDDTGPAWKPAVGTAVHAQLEHWFTTASAAGDLEGQFECERTVTVGTIAGTPITGSCDLWIPGLGVVNDWKVVGPKQLTKYRRLGPSQQYRVQAHLYARGFENAGETPQQVAITFLPRDGELGLTHFWTEPYDPDIAVQALDRADRIANNIAAMQTISAQAALDWINGLPADPDCFSCPRYPGAPQKPVAESTAALLNL